MLLRIAVFSFPGQSFRWETQKRTRIAGSLQTEKRKLVTAVERIVGICFSRRDFFFGQNQRWRKGDDTEKKKSGGEGADLAEAALERWAGCPPLPHRHSVTFPRLDIESRCRRTCTLQSKPYNNLLLQTLLWGGQVGCGLLRGRRYLHPIILSSLHRNPVLCRLSRKV